MDEPSYKIQMVETYWKKEEKGLLHRIVRNSVIVIIVLIVFFSIVFGENLFASLSSGALVLLFALVVRFFVGEKDVEVTSETEIWLYEDYVIFYRPQFCYSSKDIRREYTKIFYSELTKSYYKCLRGMLCFEGTLHVADYHFDENGTLLLNSLREREINNFFYHICTKNEPRIEMFIKEIEEHSPIKVEIVENR